MTIEEIDAEIAALESDQDRPLRELKLNEGLAPIDDTARRMTIAAYDRLKTLDQQIADLRTIRTTEVKRLADLAVIGEGLTSTASDQLPPL